METLRTRYLREVAGSGPFLGCEGTVRGGAAVMPSAATAALTAEVCSHASEEHFMVIAERHFPRSGSGTGYSTLLRPPGPISSGATIPLTLQPMYYALVTGWG